MVVNPATCSRSMTPFQLEGVGEAAVHEDDGRGSGVGVDWFMSLLVFWPANTGDWGSAWRGKRGTDAGQATEGGAARERRPSRPGAGSTGRVFMRSPSFLAVRW